MALWPPTLWFAPKPPRTLPRALGEELGLPSTDLVLSAARAYDQGFVSGCVGASLRGMLECQSMQTGLTPPSAPDWDDIWEVSKSPGFNAGASVQTALNKLRSLGVVSSFNILARTSSEQRFMVGIRALQALYVRKTPVGITYQSAEGMEYPWPMRTPNGILQLIQWDGTSRGMGHAVYVHGRFFNPQWGWMVLIRQSRGPSFGDNGSAAMQEWDFLKMFEKGGGYSMAWTLDINAGWYQSLPPKHQDIKTLLSS